MWLSRYTPRDRRSGRSAVCTNVIQYGYLQRGAEYWRHNTTLTEVPQDAPPPPVSYTKDWLKTLQQTAYPDCNAHVQMAKDLGGLTATHRAAIKAAGAEHRQTTDPERQEELVSIIRSAIMDSSVKAKAMMLKYEESKMGNEPVKEAKQLSKENPIKQQVGKKQVQAVKKDLAPQPQASKKQVQAVKKVPAVKPQTIEKQVQAVKKDPAVKPQTIEKQVQAVKVTSPKLEALDDPPKKPSAVAIPASPPSAPEPKTPKVGRIKPQVAVQKKKKKKKEANATVSTTKPPAKPATTSGKEIESPPGKETRWLSLPTIERHVIQADHVVPQDLVDDATMPSLIMLEVTEVERLGVETRKEAQRLYALGSREAQEAANFLMEQQRKRESDLKASVNFTALHHRVMSNHAALKIQQESREVAHRQALQERAKRRLLRKSEAQRLAMPPAIERATMQELPIVSSDSVGSVHDRATMSEPSSDATVRVLPPVEVSHPESVPVTNAAPEPGYSERSQPSIQRRTIFEVLQDWKRSFVHGPQAAIRRFLAEIRAYFVRRREIMAFKAGLPSPAEVASMKAARALHLKEYQETMARFKAGTSMTPTELPSLMTKAPVHASEITSLSPGEFMETLLEDEIGPQTKSKLAKRSGFNPFHVTVATDGTNASTPDENQHITYFSVQSELLASGHRQGSVYEHQAKVAMDYVSLLEDQPSCLCIYTDGSFREGGKSTAGAGILVKSSPPSPYAVCLPISVESSGESELFAILWGVFRARSGLRLGRYHSVAFITDYMTGLDLIDRRRSLPNGGQANHERINALVTLCRREMLTLARECNVHIYLAWVKQSHSAGIAMVDLLSRDGRLKKSGAGVRGASES